MTHPLPGLSVLADEERELAVRRCESALSRVVARQEGVRDLPELRDMDELIQSVESVETATSSSAFARAFEPSAEIRYGIDNFSSSFFFQLFKCVALLTSSLIYYLDI